jgi:hypothetical protein
MCGLVSTFPFSRFGDNRTDSSRLHVTERSAEINAPVRTGTQDEHKSDEFRGRRVRPPIGSQCAPSS